MRTAIYVLMAAFAVVVVLIVAANMYRGSRTKAAQPCWGKLMNIESAKEQWALENQAAAGTSVTLSNILPYMSGAPTCHIAGARYIIGKTGEEPRCTVHGTILNFKPDRY